jgi:hypothetical protein
MKVQLTRTYVKRQMQAIAETSAWIDSHPRSDLLPGYIRHLEALEQSLLLVEVVEELDSATALVNVSLLEEKIKELKA